MTNCSPRTGLTGSKALLAALVSATLAVTTACSSGHPKSHSSSKAAVAEPAPTPSGPCKISTTVACTKGVLPIWTADQVRAHLLGAKDVLPTMKHPYDPTWYGLTRKNQYMRRWATGNYIPGCHYNWIQLSGPTRMISGYNYL